MARIPKKLTNTQITNAKPKKSLYRVYDGDGLCLKITPSNSKIWEYRFKNPDTGKDDTLVIGNFPLISLAEAREKHQAYRKNVVDGINPKSQSNDKSFSHIYEQWFSVWSKKVPPAYASQTDIAIKKYGGKYLFHLNVDEMRPKHIVNFLQKIEKSGSLSLIGRLKSTLSQIFRFAISKGLCETDPATVVSLDAFSRHVPTPHESLKMNEVYILYNFFKNANTHQSVRHAFEMILRTMSRTQEITRLKKEYVNYQDKAILIPAQAMKMRRPHVIPLTDRMVEILKAQGEEGRYIFSTTGLNPISTQLLSYHLKVNNINSTVHGFRHLASTILNESRLFHPDLIELSLAHQDKNTIRRTYNNAQYIEQRREMLQWWSDFIDKCDTQENNERALKEAGISLI